ncbi:MAG TPA: methyltransferase domain-containing protein, partial [Thermoleophilia bacterium]|nr:methyltransferase domain-containing protein [Thermoleophilia bacterium]
MSCDYTDPDTWWDEYQAHYGRRSSRDYRPLLAEVVGHGLEGPLLDVGAGYGFLVECARRFGIAAIGVEGSPNAVSICRERHPLADIRFWRAGTDLPVESSTIGVVVANEFIDHITPDQNALLFK